MRRRAPAAKQWCVNCHAPGENLRPAMPAWSAVRDPRAREPMRDLLPGRVARGDLVCRVPLDGGARRGARLAARGYEGNPTWVSTATGVTFLRSPGGRRGIPGIANSGYRLDPRLLLGGAEDGAHVHPSPEGAHRTLPGVERVLRRMP